MTRRLVLLAFACGLLLAPLPGLATSDDCTHCAKPCAEAATPCAAPAAKGCCEAAPVVPTAPAERVSKAPPAGALPAPVASAAGVAPAERRVLRAGADARWCEPSRLSVVRRL